MYVFYMIYICPKCNKIFDRKSTYDYHVYKRKKPCKNNNMFSCSKCKKNFSTKFNLSRHQEKYCKYELKKNKSDKTFICSYCNDQFSRKYTMERHIKSRCEIKRKLDTDKEEIYNKLIKQLKKQNKKIEKLENDLLNKEIETYCNDEKDIHQNKGKKHISTIKEQTINNINNFNNNVNNTLNVQNNYNIKLVAFGQEDLSYIDDKTAKMILKKGYRSIPELIEYVHFNSDKPENHNIYIPNMRDVYVLTFDGKSWILVEREEVIKTLYDEKYYYLVEKFNELKSDLDNITVKKFTRFSGDSGEDVTKLIMKEIKLLLYNKRDVPVNTRKNIEIENHNFLR